MRRFRAVSLCRWAGTAACALASSGCSWLLPFEGLSESEESKAPCRFDFESETRFATAGYTQDVAIADFDRDARLDLVVAKLDPDSDSTGPELLRGDGKGQFESWYQSAKFGLISRSIAARDIDGDLLGDVAISYQSLSSSTPSGSFDVELGDGQATLGHDGQIFDVPQAGDIALGDFNGDGRTDAAVIATQAVNQIADEKLYVFLGQPDGRLALPAIYASNELDNTFNAVTAGDLNGDGRTDLCVSHWGRRALSVMLGATDGSFFIRGPFETGSIPRGMAIADFTHDGLPDIAVVNNSDNTVSVLAGLGDGQFGNEKPYQMLQGPTYVVAADFDGDGMSDLVASGDDRIALRLGTASGDFAEPALFPIDGSALQLATGDLNGDGVTDLAAANPARKSVSVFLGRCRSE